MNQTAVDNLLAERIAEHEMAVAFARELIAALGEKPALRILGRAAAQFEAAGARELARRLGDNSLRALGEHFRRRQERQDTVTVVEATDQRLEIRVTRCPSTEALRFLGMPQLCPLFCASTHALTTAFNAGLRASHTQSIGTGGAYCDWVWTWREGGAPEDAAAGATGGEDVDEPR